MIDFLLQLFVTAPSDSTAFVVETIGLATGIVSVWMIARENIWGWPVGILNVLVYIWIFWTNDFVSDTILFAIFLPLQVYGWIDWGKTGNVDRRTFTALRLTQREAIAWFLSGVGATIVWGTAVRFLFESPALPYHDAATTVFSLIAQYLMARRFIECWILWMAVDVLAPMNYLEKGLLPTAVLFLVYLGLAVTGFVEWKRTLDITPPGDAEPA